MSLVVFPFKQENPEVIGANFDAAARHGRVDEVWGVAADEGASLDHARGVAATISTARGKRVSVFPQERLGLFRPGKGDGMNTAIRRAASAGFERIHFYDADITNFDESWIEGAESAADRGYEVVRHRFPRASTDAMITWMITRPSLAMLFPGTILPRLGQPLGGELLISGDITSALAKDEFVRARSDWGIDTVITHATAVQGSPMYEHNVAEGKRHALYGSLDEIRVMALECLDAVRSLAPKSGGPEDPVFSSDPPAPVPEGLKHVAAYDVERTKGLLTADWTDDESDLVEALPGRIAAQVARNRVEPNYRFMDADAWGDVLAWLLRHFRLGDPPWESLAFRLWLMRVLAYTSIHVPAGYDAAIDYLESTIVQYERRGPGLV